MENVVLYGPGGASPVNVGSWLLADPGPDYGARGLVQAVEAETFGDGGIFVYDRAPIRKMAFPLMPASGGAGLSLTQLESLLRFNARPGGYIDVQPDGVPSAEAVRFDIVHGRWEPAHSIPINRAFRRPGTLYLDTQPWGYWPTVILLASGVSPSYQDTFQLSWAAGQIIGDAPARAVIGIHASGATYSTVSSGGYGLGQNYRPDGLWWSLGRPSGATGFMVPSDFTVATSINNNPFTGSNNVRAATVAPVGPAPFGALLRLDLQASGIDAWKQIAIRQMGASTGQLYAGRYRVYGTFRFWQFSPSAGSNQMATMPMQLALDEALGSYTNMIAPMASAYPVATVVPVRPTTVGVASPWPEAFLIGDGGVGGATEPGFQLVDFGEHQLPPLAASGAWTPWQLRLWARMGTSFVGTIPRLDFAGLRIQAVQGPAGILGAGMSLPSTNTIAGTDGAGGQWGSLIQTDSFVVDAINNRVALWQGSAMGAGSNLASPIEILADGRRSYHGQMPLLGGTEIQLDVGLIDRSQITKGATTILGNITRAKIAASVSYQPRFRFLRGL